MSCHFLDFCLNVLFKELRVEDYMASRKFGTGAGATSTGSMFGQQGNHFSI
jgi:hypothetical protein